MVALGLGLAGSGLLGMISFFGLRVIDFTPPLHLKGPSTSCTRPYSRINTKFHLSFLKEVLVHIMIVLTKLSKLDEERKFILKPKNVID